MKEYSLCQTAEEVPSEQGRCTLASSIPSSSKSETETHLSNFLGLGIRGPKMAICFEVVITHARIEKNVLMLRSAGSGSYLEESYTPYLLALCMLSLYLVQLLRDVSALPPKELE